MCARNTPDTFRASVNFRRKIPDTSEKINYATFTNLPIPSPASTQPITESAIIPVV